MHAHPPYTPLSFWRLRHLHRYYLPRYTASPIAHAATDRHPPGHLLRIAHPDACASICLVFRKIRNAALVLVPLAQPTLRNGVFALDRGKRGFNAGQGFLGCQVAVRRLVAAVAKMLDVLAAGLHLEDAEGGAGTL